MELDNINDWKLLCGRGGVWGRERRGVEVLEGRCGEGRCRGESKCGEK